MAEAVFFVHAEFCHGLSQLWQEKDGVVTESACAALFRDDLARADAFCKMDLAIRDRNGNCGVEVRSPWAGCTMKFTQKIFAPFRIR
jgi:hypothetical protein